MMSPPTVQWQCQRRFRLFFYRGCKPVCKLVSIVVHLFLYRDGRGLLSPDEAVPAYRNPCAARTIELRHIGYRHPRSFAQRPTSHLLGTAMHHQRRVLLKNVHAVKIVPLPFPWLPLWEYSHHQYLHHRVW